MQEELTVFSQEQGFASYLALGKVLGGWVVAEQGNREEGISQMRQNLAALADDRSRVGAARIIWQCSPRCMGKPGNPKRGVGYWRRDWLRETIPGKVLRSRAVSTQRGTHVMQSSVRSPESDVKNSPKSSVQSPGSENPSPQPLVPNTQAAEREAEVSFLKAIAIAKQQHAKSLELRATMSLARLWQQHGKQTKHTRCYPISTVGSPRGSRPPTCKGPRQCYKGYDNDSYRFGPQAQYEEEEVFTERTISKE